MALGLEDAKSEFTKLLTKLSSSDKIDFLSWLQSDVTDESTGGDTEILLEEIRRDLVLLLPPNGLSPGETVHFPKDNEMMPSNTLHIDLLLYPNEEDIDDYCHTHGIGRNYCLKCGSHKTEPLNIISHSISMEQLRYIFSHLLPDLTNKTIVDVGSRTGFMLYGGYVYSNACRLVGVEMNSYFHSLQETLISKYELGDRVSVIHSDICDQQELLRNADVVILHNVFEFFATSDQECRIWKFLYKCMRRCGTMLITIPAIEERWKKLKLEKELDLTSWINEIIPSPPIKWLDQEEDIQDIHLYTIL